MDLQNIFNIQVFGYSLQGLIIFLIKAIFIYLVVQIMVKFISFLFRRALNKKEKAILDETNAGFLRRICIYAIYIIGVASFLALIPGMDKVSNSILASAGILAMAVGFASQEALSNIISGMFIIFSKPFRVGDYIKLDANTDGTVTEITLRHTVIRNLENRMILIPNSVINKSTIMNSTINDPATKTSIEIGVSYATDLNHAMDVMREEINKHPLLLKEDKEHNPYEVVIQVTQLGDSAITLRAFAWASTSGNAFTMKCDLLKSIKERFDKENIEIPYPTFNQVIQKV